MIAHSKDIYLVENQADLTEAIAFILQCNEIGIDTEFDNNRLRYGMNLCVIQVFAQERCFIIDPLNICKTETNTLDFSHLQAFWQIVESDKILKIVFSGSEDLILFCKYGATPQNFFDVSVAVRVLGLPYPSFVDLASHFLGETINKGMQCSDWYVRPLTENLLGYLRGDVAYLIKLKNILQPLLLEANRWNWFDEEMQSLVANNSAFPSKESALEKTAINKFKVNLLVDFERFIIKELLTLRDYYARIFDVPEYRVFTNETLLSFVPMIRELAGLADSIDIKGIHGNIKKSYSEEFVAKIKQIYDRAIADNLSATKNSWVSDHSKTNRKDLTDFTTFLDPIKTRLTEKYGTDVQILLLSNSHIKKLFYAQSFLALKNYAAAEIQKAAAEMGLDVSRLAQ